MRAGPSPAPTPCEQVFLSSTGPRHTDRDASRHHLLPARANLALPRRRARGRCRAPALRDQRAAARRRRLRPCARRVRANPRHRALERRALQLGYCHEQLGPSRFQQGRHRPLEQLRAAKRFAARHAPNASDTANRSNLADEHGHARVTAAPDDLARIESVADARAPSREEHGRHLRLHRRPSEQDS